MPGRPRQGPRSSKRPQKQFCKRLFVGFPKFVFGCLAPNEAQEPSRAPQRGGQKRPTGGKRTPRASQERPTATQGKLRRGPGGPRAAREPKMALPRRKMGPKRSPGGSKKAQGRPSIRHKRTQEQRSQGKKIQVETRQQKTRPEARRDNKLTKGLPEPVSPETLSPYPTYFSHLMHGSTLVYIYIYIFV